MPLLSLKQANETIQALEARGDFKYRGIQELYSKIVKWTEQFDTNGVLISYDQLAQDSKLPEEKIRSYLMELIGRGSSNIEVVALLPSLQYLPGSGARLDPVVTFCRPLEADQNSPARYIQSQIQKNTKAIANWLDSRTILDEAQMREKLIAAIAEGKLPLTRARAHIARLFRNDFDVTDEQRKNTNQTFVKPILKNLLDLHKLLLLQGADPGGNSFNALFFNNDTELERRASILIDYFRNHITKESPGEEEGEIDFVKRTIGEIGDRFSSLKTGEQQLIQELMVLAPRIEKVRQKQEEEAKTEKLEKIVEMLLQFDHVVEASVFRDFPADTVDGLYNVSGVLSTEFVYKGKLTHFYLHRNKIDSAIKHARELFDRTEDETQVQILSAMGLEKYLDRDHYKAFLDLEEHVLFNHLPFFTRLWRALFGNRRLKQKEVVALKKKIQKKQAEEKIKIRKVEAARKRKELASERLKESRKRKGKSSASRGSGDSGFGKPEEESNEEKLARVKQMEDAKEKMRKVVHELDEAWNRGEFPNRETLMEALGDLFADENDLIMFLKKYGKKEIYSFKIQVEKPEFVWPILISRRYLKKHGKSLYNKYQEIAVKQREAQMPDQEKFDIANSIELFLGRILPKL